MRRLILSLAALALTACGGSDVTTPGETKPAVNSIAGVYTLKTVDGASLPFTFSDGFIVMTDVMTLRSDNTWSETYTGRETANSPIQSVTDAGTYTLEGNALKLFVPGQTTSDYGGTYTKDTLTLISFGHVQVFVR